MCAVFRKKITRELSEKTGQIYSKTEMVRMQNGVRYERVDDASCSH
jgi:hypothetical protein